MLAVTGLDAAADTHAHIFDPVRFPFHPSSVFEVLPNTIGNSMAPPRVSPGLAATGTSFRRDERRLVLLWRYQSAPRVLMRLLQPIVLIALTLPLPAPAQTAADYPAKPVRVIVPTSPGSGTDATARLSAQKLSENLKRQFVVDNRAGGGGQIAYGFVAKAPADGYTLLTVPPSFTFTQALYPDFPHDALRDFTPISLLTKSSYLVLVHPSLPVKSVKQLIALARAKPNALSVGVGFSGSFTNLAVVSFAHAANIKVTLIPYRGTGDVLINAIAGHVQMFFGDVTISLPHVNSGRLRALAVSSAERSPVLPQLPTIAESGLPGYDVVQWIAWVAPAGTPAPIVNKLSAELAKAIRSPDVVKYLSESGGEAVGSTPEELQQVIAAEAVRWRKVIKETGMRVE
jgi:tripartite-type tricarboxylate transporter receptor subunit TctC